MGVALIGFMGCGKTTVGQTVGIELGWQFWDTDILIEQMYGPISRIFETEGEKRFREIESSVITRLKIIPETIISTGGGAVIRPENMQYLKNFCQTIWLKRNITDILKRPGPDPDRPLWIADNQKMTELYLKRSVLYQKYADIIIENKNLRQTIDLVRNYAIDSLRLK